MLGLVFLPIIEQEVLMECHPSEVTRTRIRVIGVNFSDQRKGNFARVRVNRGKLTKNWGEIQAKWDLLRVSGEFELSEFELSTF